MSKKKIGTSDHEFVGREKSIKSTRGGAAIGGNVNNSNIVTGNHNVITSTSNLQEQYLQQVYEAIDTRENTNPYEKDDLKSDFKEIQAEDEKGEIADKGLISYKLENIKKMAPDILDVVLTTIANPLAGFGMVARKIAEKMKTETKK